VDYSLQIVQNRWWSKTNVAAIMW